MKLLSAEWWKAALIRALRTAIMVAVPYLGAVVIADVPWITIGSAAAMAFIASLVTSLGGLAEVSGATEPWWYSALGRVVKTFAQSLAAGFGTSLLISDVDWSTILQAAAIASLASLLTAIIGNLPEAPNPVAATLVVATAPGDEHETAVPVVATVPAAAAVPVDDAPKHAAE